MHDADRNSIGIRQVAIGRTAHSGLEHHAHDMQPYYIGAGASRNRAMSVANIDRSQRGTQHEHDARDDYDSEDDQVSVPEDDNESISGVDDRVDN